MTAFVVVLAALQLAVPVRCYEAPTVWQQQLQAFGVRSDAAGYYSPDPASIHIGLGPWACRQVRHPTLDGAFVLAHELAHYWQHRTGRPFSEEQADRIAARRAPGLLRRLERLLGRSPQVVRLEQ